VTTLKNEGCQWIYKAYLEIKQMKQLMSEGWKKCGILPFVFEENYQLRSKLDWMSNNYDVDKIHIPWRDNRAVPVIESEEKKEEVEEIAQQLQQLSGFTDEGEDEEEETAAVMKECINDGALAEALQAEEDELY
jgi:hypothetical protein